MPEPKKKPHAARPKLHLIGEEMQQWSALLAGEVAQWPAVTLKPMFGMKAFYRKAMIFAAVPATRSLGSPNSVIFKIIDPAPDLRLRLEADPRIDLSDAVGQKWHAFELSSPGDLRDALSWFSEAYEASGHSAPRKKSKRKPTSKSRCG